MATHGSVAAPLLRHCPLYCHSCPSHPLHCRYGTFTGINRKVQFKLLSKKDQDGAPQMLLILKWGGEQTQSGQQQAEELGRAFRIIYPGGEGEYASLPGSGFLRLHSTYRHDLKVYASDEGRVQMTAAAFTKVCTGLSSLSNFTAHETFVTQRFYF